MALCLTMTSPQNVTSQEEVLVQEIFLEPVASEYVLMEEEVDEVDVVQVQDKVVGNLSVDQDTSTLQQPQRNENIFYETEQQASFPGGMSAYMRWLASNMRYPEDAQEGNIQGKVIVKFIVRKDGTIDQPVIAKGVHPSLDKEAIRVVKKMPRWQPGRNNGVAVDSYYILPIVFRLNN